MYLITFHTNFDANLFSKKNKEVGKVKMKPVPRQLSSSCGTCVSFEPFDENFDVNTISHMAFESVYRVQAGDNYELLLSKE